MSVATTSANDIDPQETQEWLEALAAVAEGEGIERAHYLLERLIDAARRSGVDLPYSANTAYLNSIPPDREQYTPGDPALEWRIRSINRWNAMAMVVKANRKNSEFGGHIASYASAATLYEVGYSHFWRAPTPDYGGDMIFMQGHSAPGIYARAFLLGLISEDELNNFRQEVDGGGLSSYPHPWLMPKFWQFPTVSMGLGPIMAIYQARFMRYLEHRGLMPTQGRKVWAFMGDGEMDEPESFGAAALASREKLDNLVFVINCNLQRLDGPVRGNGKIIQELESDFRGAGWNVIKVIWGAAWDHLLAKDTKGVLLRRMEEVVDGEYQAMKAVNGAYVREHFFGKYPELKQLVASMSDDDIWRLNRGGHDPHKVFAAYSAAMTHTGQPTVILCKTVKGYGMGEAGEGKMITHQQKKMGEAALKHFRDRFNIPVSDADLAGAPFYRPPEDSPEMKYLRERTAAMGGFLPQRRPYVDEPLRIPDISIFDAMLKSTGDRDISTTMAFVRLLAALTRDKTLGPRIVPIVPDEARTFGMEGMFRQLGIYSSVGQLYEPVDHDELMYYREDIKGQILEEGINEAGGMCSWIAAATAYSNHNLQMIPFFIFYSMFGFQRVGDLAWAAGDMQARGFLLGGTSGRTTLAGEGLQHQDGHSHLLAATIPNCRSYDPTFAYELAVIVHDGLKRMIEQQENCFYYITVMNENYVHPGLPPGVESGIVKGMYSFQREQDATIDLLGSGAILREVIAAAELLKADFSITANIWSVTSFNELRRDGLDCERWNLLHPEDPPRTPFVTQCLNETKLPVVAATDYLKAYADQIREFVPTRYRVLGTDGFGRSDSRAKLREFFEVNRFYIVVAALKTLADNGAIAPSQVNAAINKYEIDRTKPNPATV
jgi:pyruvate dehydrogenase E1 component